jgi:hypothetical protein
VSLADLYRTAIHDNRRAVVSYRGHRTAWHILVTSRQGYVAIVVLGLGGEKEEGSRVPVSTRLIVEILFSSSYQCDLYSTVRRAKYYDEPRRDRGTESVRYIPLRWNPRSSHGSGA